MTTTSNPVFCALDTPEVSGAVALASQIKNNIGGFKVGLEFFLANGAAGYRQIAELGMPMFLDVKLHDIPNTVKGAVQSLLPLRPRYITIHTGGGPAMMRAAADAAAQGGTNRPKLLGVTVLTSLDSKDLESVGQCPNVGEQVSRLAILAKNSGLDGIVCAPTEIATLRQLCGPDFILMVPGIRPAWSASNDQKRVMTPKEAVAAGATHLVIGRPITGAQDPAEAAAKIAAEIG